MGMGFICHDLAKTDQQSSVKPHPPLDLPLKGEKLLLQFSNRTTLTVIGRHKKGLKRYEPSVLAGNWEGIFLALLDDFGGAEEFERDCQAQGLGLDQV